jgi:DNA-binding MarR family transcriptional regulator
MTEGEQPMSPVHRFVAYLRHCRSEGALWTSDIAAHFKMNTATANRELRRLERAGEVERVVTGNPISWRPTRYE